MILTQIQLDLIRQQVQYEPETGQFHYTQDRFVDRRFKKEMVVPPAPKKAHSQGDRADKLYGGQFIGVYVLGKALNAAHIALFLQTGDWPQAIRYLDGNWRNLKLTNLEAITRSQQTTEAANTRYAGQHRNLPPNVYSLSNGKYIGRKGVKKTREYPTVREVLSAIERDRWLEL